MSIYDEKLIHTPRLFAKSGVSRELGTKVLKALKVSGEITPEISPSKREFVSPKEAALFQQALLSR